MRDRIPTWRGRGPLVALETLGSADRSTAVIAGDPLLLAEFRGGQWALTSGRFDAQQVPLTDRERGDPFGGMEAILEKLAESGAVSSELGAYGFFGYECAAPPGAARGEPRSDGIPDAWFLFTDRVEHTDGTLRDPQAGSLPGDPQLFAHTDLSFEEYSRSFVRIREFLRQGQSYQLCFTYPIRRRYSGDPLELYEALCRRNPAPFAAFLEAPGFAIASSSPERFLTCSTEGRVEAEPMKGTARRTGDVAVDRERLEALQRSVKDRAENLMIADLLRNDLGRVCQLGSVRAVDLAAVREHATVFQLVSRVQGQLEEGVPRSELLHAAFPPGSMTGAPKARSVELLRTLEQGPRGPYSGILGYWRADGTMDFSVLIRTWVVAQGEARCGVGGGVVWDSQCDEEYEESRIKARAMLWSYEEAIHQAARSVAP